MLLMADMEMMAAFFCVDSSISYCVLPLVFVQGNNHAADDINSCEYTVNAAGHINLCCLDLRIFTVHCGFHMYDLVIFSYTNMSASVRTGRACPTIQFVL